MRAKVWTLFAALAAIGLLAPAAADARYLFATHAGVGAGGINDLIRTMSLGADGTPVGVQTLPQTGKGSSAAVMSADGRFIYIANYSFGRIEAYNVATDGSLTSIGQTDVGSLSGPYGTAISPNGKTLYAANDSNGGASGNPGVITVLPINPDGTAGPGGSSVLAGNDSYGLAVTPDNRHVYVGNTGTNNVSGFNIQPDGTLVKVADYPMPAGATGPKGVAVSPDGTHLYVANAVSDNISIFTISTEGVLLPVANTASAGTNLTAVAISPDGRHLFAENGSMAQTIFAYNVNGDGTLTGAGAGVSLGTTLASFPGLAVSADSTRVYGSSSSLGPAGRLGAFAVQPAGGLVAISGSPFDTGGQGNGFQSVVIQPDQGPNASFTAKSSSRTTHVVFDASGTTDPDGSVVRYDWDFGDGSGAVNGGATITHDYAKPGAYNARMTATDNEGCSSGTIYTGQVASCNGPNASATQTVGALGLDLSGKTSQKLSSKGIKVDVQCVGVNCAVDLAASVKLSAKASAAKKHKKKKKKGKTLHFKTVKGRNFEAGKTATVTIGFSKKTYKSLQKALRKTKSVTAKVKATSNTGGIAVSASRNVKITKPAAKKHKRKRHK